MSVSSRNFRDDTLPSVLSSRRRLAPVPVAHSGDILKNFVIKRDCGWHPHDRCEILAASHQARRGRSEIFQTAVHAFGIYQ
ncbi:hypothetical protein [Caballeronia sp. Sq4a]|uniref:hypothetical protein n=1 Tax=Caballeronia sp. Sq4a TaxID=2878152 RepID=UPI0020C0465D|nr:hypothetical protein [Caballeronia sp. Sq4a]